MATADNTYDYQAMANAATAMDTAETSIAGIINTVDSTVGALTSSWTGQAHQIFSGALQTWLEQMGSIRNDLNTMWTVLTQNNASFQAGEEEHIQASTQLQNALAGLDTVL